MPRANVKVSQRNKAALREKQFASGNKLRNFVPNETHEGAVPCFHCSDPSVACKQGKSMCRRHLDLTRGVEYPLRQPFRTPELKSLDTYLTYMSAASAL